MLTDSEEVAAGKGWPEMMNGRRMEGGGVGGWGAGRRGMKGEHCWHRKSEIRR